MLGSLLVVAPVVVVDVVVVVVVHLVAVALTVSLGGTSFGLLVSRRLICVCVCVFKFD